MDIGDWIFIGVAVVSGIASITKSTKKKATEQAPRSQPSTGEGKTDADDWLGDILRETTKKMFDPYDEYIPKNKPQPQVERGNSPQGMSTASEKTVNAESYRRINQSLEGDVRPFVSLEDTAVVEGDVKHVGLHASLETARPGLVTELPTLDPADDFMNAEEVRKALIYGEIMRPKF